MVLLMVFIMMETIPWLVGDPAPVLFAVSIVAFAPLVASIMTDPHISRRPPKVQAVEYSNRPG